MGTGKKKIEIKKIEKHTARMVTFSKRRQGLFKKAQEYAEKTNSQVALLVFSPAGKPFVHGSPCFDTVVEKFMNENNCRDSVAIDENTLIREIFNNERGQEDVWIGGECMTNSGGVSGRGDEALIEEFWNGEWGQEDVWMGGGESMTNSGDSVEDGEKNLIEECLTDERGQEGVWIDEECVTNNGGGGGGGDETLIEEFWVGEWGQENVWTGSGECMTNNGDGVDDGGKTLIEEYLNHERGQEDVCIDGECDTNSGGGGGGNDVAEMFSWLEDKMRRCESMEELMEVRTVLENMKDKAMKRLKHMQEDNFVASLFSSDFRVSPTPPDQTLLIDQLLPHH